jgi:hypothetical protein
MSSCFSTSSQIATSNALQSAYGYYVDFSDYVAKIIIITNKIIFRKNNLS